MTADPRAALDRLIAAFEAHLRALENTRNSDDDSVVERAYEILADAYEAYDEALGETFDESTPLVIDDDDDYDDDDDIVLVDDETDS
ncbi:MAG TPA: DNA primase [Actinomycetales bacterium]|nr:DNA primase [Actinomycetales bacterium]